MATTRLGGRAAAEADARRRTHGGGGGRAEFTLNLSHYFCLIHLIILRDVPFREFNIDRVQTLCLRLLLPQLC